MSEPHLLVVTYGGGHVKMMIPVIRKMLQRGWKVSVLGLTIAGPILKKENIPYYQFRHFLEDTDQDALIKGKELAQSMHMSDGVIPEEESIAYLGLSYVDLVKRLGPAEAEKLFREKKRHAFLPLTVLRRVMDRIQPNIVLTTNSPRAERAAVIVAKERKIPTISLVNLFGMKEMYTLDADKICVLSNVTKNNLVKSGVSEEKICITGNPAFDPILDFNKNCNNSDPAWRLTHLRIKANTRCILWIDQPGCWRLKKNELHLFSKQDTLANLENLYQTTRQLNAKLLVRAHPSQSEALFNEWSQRYSQEHVQLVTNLPLYPLLANSDVVISRNSTVSIEASMLNKPILSLYEKDEQSDVPLAEYGLALSAISPKEIYHQLLRLLNDEETIEKLNRSSKEFFNQTTAAGKVIKVIESLYN